MRVDGTLNQTDLVLKIQILCKLRLQNMKVGQESFDHAEVDDPYWPIVVYWRHMATQIWVNFGSGNGLLPDGTRP